MLEFRNNRRKKREKKHKKYRGERKKNSYKIISQLNKMTKIVMANWVISQDEDCPNFKVKYILSLKPSAFAIMHFCVKFFLK